MNIYATNRVFAKILVFEVRNHTDYYKSTPYKLVKNYSDIVLDIIKEGIENGEIRDDLSPTLIRQSILGSIEHVCLTSILFSREISPDLLTEELCEFIFKGIEK